MPPSASTVSGDQVPVFPTPGHAGPEFGQVTFGDPAGLGLAALFGQVPTCVDAFGLVQAEADAAGEIDWDVAVDSTSVRAHQHAAGARLAPPPALKRGSV